MLKKCTVIAIALIMLAAAAYAQYGVETAQKMPEGVSIQRIAAMGVPDYDNTTTTSGYYYKVGSSIVLDDITRTTNQDIVGISAGFGTTTLAGAFDANVYFYTMDQSTGDVGTLLASYSLTGIPVGWYLLDLDLPEPLPAAQDLYLGMSFSDANAGLLLYNPPTVGYSLNYFAKSTDNGATWGYYYFGDPPNPAANFCLQTRVVPEPGSMLALGGGLVGLLAFCRRRK